MRNVGMGELMVIILIGLLVVGPKRIPEIARNLGKAWRVFQQESRKAQNVFKEAFDEIDKPAPSAKGTGVIDKPDAAAPKPAAEPAGPAAVPDRAPPEPPPELVEQAAVVEPDDRREFEDT